MKRILACLVILCLVLGCLPAMADQEKAGSMEVVNCNEWVSLREEPSTKAQRLVKVSLGAVVSNCVRYSDEWVYAEYDGYAGYILSEYLQPCDNVLTFNAMVITLTDGGAPFFSTVDSIEPVDVIPTDTVVRNCCVMDNGRVYVEWGSRCGFINLAHAEVYGEMVLYPEAMQMTVNLFDGIGEEEDAALQIVYADEFPLADHAYNEYDYTWDFPMDDEESESGYPFVHFVLYTDQYVSEVHLINTVENGWDIETGEAEYELEIIHIQPEITPEKPLRVTAVLYGSMPNLAVGYKDEAGMYHFAFVEMSGEDGHLMLNEF